MAEQEPQLGHVRLTGGPDKSSFLIEAFSGGEWITLRGITGVSFEMEPPFSGPVRLKLTVRPQSVAVVAGMVDLEETPPPVP